MCTGYTKFLKTFLEVGQGLSGIKQQLSINCFVVQDFSLHLHPASEEGKQ
jgi:hypothetical protein